MCVGPAKALTGLANPKNLLSPKKAFGSLKKAGKGLTSTVLTPKDALGSPTSTGKTILGI